MNVSDYLFSVKGDVRMLNCVELERLPLVERLVLMMLKNNGVHGVDHGRH